MIKPGTILISHPKVTKGTFVKSVILITEHHRTGTVGFVLNKPQNFEMKELIPSLINTDACVQKANNGGPVSPLTVCMIHTNDWNSHNTAEICDDLLLTSDRYMIDLLNDDVVPSKYKFFVGFCSWYPGQLEKELTDQNFLKVPFWLTTTLDNCEIVFDEKINLWEHFLNQYAQKITSCYF